MTDDTLPPGAAAAFVSIDGGRARVLRSVARAPEGATPLLLVHGGGTDNAAISWRLAFDAFGAERPVLAIDLPGFGRTDLEPVGGPDAMAAFVARIASALELDRAIVGGVSMGGDVALNVALRHPALVEALVLVAPGGLVPRVGGRAVHLAAWLAAQLPDRVLVPLANAANRRVEAVLRAMVHDPERLPAGVLAEFAREAAEPGAGMGYGRYNQSTLGWRGMRNDLMPLVDRIEAPTLIVLGARDRLVPPAGSRAASERMPHARLVLVDDCGHWAQLEASERFAREVRAFLDELGA